MVVLASWKSHRVSFVSCDMRIGACVPIEFSRHGACPVLHLVVDGCLTCTNGLLHFEK
jgi:hypothetical protein